MLKRRLVATQRVAFLIAVACLHDCLDHKYVNDISAFLEDEKLVQTSKEEAICTKSFKYLISSATPSTESPLVTSLT